MSLEPVPQATAPDAAPAQIAELILNHISTCVVTVDESRRASFANRMALSMLQVPSVVGRDVSDLFGSPELAAVLDGLPVGGEQRLDFHFNRSDGPVEMGMTVVRARPHAPRELAFALLFRDLADLRQVEMELRRVERLSALGKMVAGLSHEMRNPLTGLQFLSEALMGELDADDPRHAYASRMQSLVARIEGLIQACLQFSEPRAVDRRTVSAHALADALRNAPASRKGRGWPRIDTDAQLPLVDVDVGQIVESVLCLVENAIDAAGDAERVRVFVREDSTPGLVTGAARVVRIDVSDQGPGVPPEQLALICDPFYTTKEKGTGLGLSIAHTLIRRNGGRLLVQSTPGRGSIFSVALPAAATLSPS